MMRFWLWRVLPALIGMMGALVAGTEYAVARPSRRTADVVYVPVTDTAYNATRHRLDVYAPKEKSATPRPVVVFIHGGSWNSGSKNFYSFIGRRLAKQGVVVVIINYRLAPQVRVPQMTDDCARAVAWTAAHIQDYGGDPQRLFVMGHSAGGGLAALLTADDALFRRWGLPRNPIKGAILDDPAGLDMYDYLQKMQYPNDEQYLVPFSKNPAVWKQTSALYHVTTHTPPFILFIGGETYPSISSSSARFRERLLALGHAPQYTVLPGKKHIPMVLQLYWQHNIIYRQLLDFVGS
ncbi:alpha/beta hydrolase [Hymenobacter endophyticus]|uniref:Alpha/beta hydrolase n=1 Tax=Hymenobacter endophyticus TaxID=3076335 RepID=A0ABU3TEN1_9BACT|nr:alpha/beta hydrolase [Hymenobacter endophyticus]MDU0369822.1 alpha/beta hydrolase [Hymenobacter endophyticus]